MPCWRLFFRGIFTVKSRVGMDHFEKNLLDSFDELGVSYSNAVIEKCLEICKKYNVTDAEEFVDTWMAYSVSHLQGENPTLVNLAKFEREEFVKKPKESSKPPESLNRSMPVIYGGSNIRERDEAARILMAINETTPKTKGGSSRDDEAGTGSGIKRKYFCDSSPREATFSPASYSSTVTTPSAKYVSRKNAGEVVFRHNDDEANRNWICGENYVAKIEVNSTWSSPVTYYMHNSLTDYLDYWDGNIEKIGKLICAKHSLEEEMPLAHRSVAPFVLVGRIACDGEGRFKPNSVLLEGTSENSSGTAVDLDLSILKKFSIFPGQVVAIEGHNVTRDRLVVRELHCDPGIDRFKACELPRGSLHVMVAAGPYTPSDSLTYQPLLDLISEAVKVQPHVLILTGPFVDPNHPLLSANAMAETAEEFFEKIMEQIAKPLERKRTHVLIINSHKELTSPMVYPTPQMKLKTKRPHPKLHLLPDPSVFAAEDVVFGVTSTDVLLHLSKEEISCSQETGRLSRLAKHILLQRSFYPLAPAKEVPVDPLLMNHARLDVAPHVLILPSDLRYFIQNVDDCTVVNPERLAKGLIGGTYARLIVSPKEVAGNIVRI